MKPQVGMNHVGVIQPAGFAFRMAGFQRFVRRGTATKCGVMERHGRARRKRKEPSTQTAAAKTCVIIRKIT